MHCGGAIADPEAGRPTGSRRIGETLPVWRSCTGPALLTAVWVPDSGHEAMRDLVRARLDAVRALRRARQQLSGFLLRQSCHYRRPAWTKLHRRWLAGLKFEQVVHHVVLEDYIAAVEAAETRRIGSQHRSKRCCPIGYWRRSWLRCRQCAAWLWSMRQRWSPTGRPLALRQSAPTHGVSWAGAIGAFERGEHQTRWPHQGRQQRGPSAADRGGLDLSLSGSGEPRVAAPTREHPKPIREIAWKAQLRLCARSRKLARSGKPATIVTAAIARELAGFVWAIARRLSPVAR